MQPLVHHQTSYPDLELGAPQHEYSSPEPTETLRNQTRANFSIDQRSLNRILDANNLEFLQQYGGVRGIALALETNLEIGVKGDEQDIHLRVEQFGSNLFVDEDGDELALTATKYNFKLALESAKEPTTILLLCCATLSVLLGVLKYGVEFGWCDGAIMFFVVFVSIFVKLYKERTRQIISTKTNAESNSTVIVDVIRDGNFQEISASQIVVGEIVILKTGNRVPADGLFVSGSSSFKLDDVEDEDEDTLGVDYYHFPAIHTGTKVMVGECRMLVISVGKNTWRRGNITNRRNPPLLAEVDKLGANMDNIALVLSLVLLVLQLLYYFWNNSHSRNGGKNEGESKSSVNTSMEELINEAAITIKKNSSIFTRLVAVLGVVLMGVREGLNLGIFITFLYSKRKLKNDHEAIVTNLPACAGLGLVTTIYTCETVDLALSETSMANLWIGGKIVKKVRTELTHELLHTLREGIGLSLPHITSRPFKDALLCWANLFLGINMEELVQSCTILLHQDDEEAEEAITDVNCRRLLLKRNGENRKNIIHTHWRGPLEKVLPMCSHFYSVDGQRNSMDDHQRIGFEQIATDSHHYIAFAYKQDLMEEEEDDDDEPPPKLIKQKEKDFVDDQESEKEKEPSKPLKQNLTLLGIVELKNPYPEELKQAVKAIRDDGVNITLILNHDKSTATFMGINSGVLSPNDDISKAVVEASEIRNIPEDDDDGTQIRRRVDDIRVLANSSPPDMLLLLQYQKQQTGKGVAVAGRSTRDFPAFNEANVGFWIGDGGTKVAKESSSDIIMSSKSLVSIAAVIRRGRFVYVNMQEFIQLHLTVNIVGVAVNFISAAIPSGNTPLSAVQVLWVGFVTDTLGAFALAATDPPPGEIIPLALALTSKAVWRNVIVQVLYQTTILLMLHFKGKAILHVDDQATLDVIVFNTYVMCQVFGLLNARETERRSGKLFSGKTFFKKMYRNRLFVVVAEAILLLQVVAVEIAIVLMSPQMRLDSRKWLFFSTGLAALSLPIGYVAKGIRDAQNM